MQPELKNRFKKVLKKYKVPVTVGQALIEDTHRAIWAYVWAMDITDPFELPSIRLPGLATIRPMTSDLVKKRLRVINTMRGHKINEIAMKSKDKSLINYYKHGMGVREKVRVNHQKALEEHINNIKTPRDSIYGQIF